MNEKDLNRIITATLNTIGWAHKISDDAQTFTSTGYKPFDLFAVTSSSVIFIESKFQKGYKAFSFEHIREHQLKNLLRIKELSSNPPFQNYIFTYIILGVWIPNQEFSLFVFDPLYIEYLKTKEGKVSLLMKELKSLKDKGLYIPVKKERFDISLLNEKVITYERINKNSSG